ncbi:MAG: tRNA (N6-threonylcarbamoyladenosine(37)-N6)-methyltransferase TrmO [Clostridia bacterium]|nr:tRNA (N6-threonylcarbamoyladenosine(37)-N6)-methyltransferase TrmO [Clostridia bacterium]
MEIKPIAIIKTDFKDKFGVPRQSGRVSGIYGQIIFEPEFRNPDALRGIENFSHLWLIFDFSLAHTDKWSATVRPPRLGGNEKVGVFASRSPFRPNSLGLSSVRLVKIEESENGLALIVEGADLVDGTPIYDIKPYIPYADCHNDATGSFADENKNHHLEVTVSNEIKSKIKPEKLQPIIDCIADDPRPSYQNDDRIYSMRFDVYDVHFTVENDTAIIVGVDVLS